MSGAVVRPRVHPERWPPHGTSTASGAVETGLAAATVRQAARLSSAGPAIARLVHVRSLLRASLGVSAGLAFLAGAVDADANGEARTDDASARAALPDFRGDVPRFVDEAAAAGVVHRYDGPWEHFVGGGVAVLDCDGDRRPDLYVAGGASPAALYVNRSVAGGPLAFARRASAVTDVDGATGAYPLDVDDDGHLDLVVLRVGANRLLRGGPDCSFTPADARWGFDGGRAWTTAFAATYEPGARHPTLAFGNYVDRTAPGSPWGTCEDNVLHRPSAESGAADTGPGTTDASSPRYDVPLALSPGHCALSLLFTDWNRSGIDALRVTNDRHYHRGGEEQLWRLDAGRYPRRYGRADGWTSLVIWGMGIAEADLDADGYPEYALTSMGDTKLQTLDLAEAIEEDRPAYDDVAWERGATAHRPYTGDDTKPSTGWHAEFDDVNNDARLDLFIAKGNVERMEDFAAVDPDNLLLGTHDGRFVERGLEAGIARPTRGRGGAVVDLNADGRLDLVVVNRDAPLALFRQLAPRPGGNWLAVELNQPPPNRHALGATLSVRTGNVVQTRRIGVGGGHASGALGWVHVGLGVAERATLRVRWPDGEWSAPYRLFANHHVVVTRGENHVTQWFPPDGDPTAESN